MVDLENVKSIDAAVLGGKNLKLHLFLGPQNKKLDVEVVEKLLENAQAVQMVRTATVGKNALDFVLAYHLGQAVLTDPRGYFQIVSKDKAEATKEREELDRSCQALLRPGEVR